MSSARISRGRFDAAAKCARSASRPCSGGTAPNGWVTTVSVVARRAGVGIGTVFRHFPTKEALLEAVFVARLSRLADRADELARDPDPGTAFFRFLDALVELAGSKKALSDALAGAGVDVTATAAPSRSSSAARASRSCALHRRPVPCARTWAARS